MRINKRKFDVLYIAALAKLLDIYTNADASDNCVQAKMSTGSLHCPLCEVAKKLSPLAKTQKDYCPTCPWIIMTGKDCSGIPLCDPFSPHSKSYRDMTVKERIAQIIEWLKEY